MGLKEKFCKIGEKYPDWTNGLAHNTCLFSSGWIIAAFLLQLFFKRQGSIDIREYSLIGVTVSLVFYNAGLLVHWISQKRSKPLPNGKTTV
ncbi:MAG TPA: hypothetical protein PLO78_09585 [Candidatus Omnitrophota bacterium]|nr:hypothetical protein [Candidatus Omnitrophota bacterium]